MAALYVYDISIGKLLIWLYDNVHEGGVKPCSYGCPSANDTGATITAGLEIHFYLLMKILKNISCVDYEKY